MTRVSGNPLSAAFATKAVKVDTPADALKRLDLRGPAAAEWDDIVKLDATGVQRLARAIDDERVALQDAFEGGGNADTALKHIEDLLSDADKLAAANGKSGTAHRTRRENQATIDKLFAELETTARDVKLPNGDALLNGDGQLATGRMTQKPEFLKLDRVALESLGNTSVGGRSVSLADIARRKPLDTSGGKRSDVADARRSIELAQQSIAAMREKIQAFQKDELRPRLGDVATTMAGIYTSTSLGTTDEAYVTARELRTMTLQSATLATALGADGWDRERALDLLT